TTRTEPTPPPARAGGIQGSLADMPLLEILQGVEFNAKTGHVEVEGGGVQGVIEFQEGSPWDARASDGSTGEKAIRRLLAVGEGSFALRSDAPRDGTRRVKVSFTRLMLDASRVSDESGRHEVIVDEPGPAPDDPDTAEIPLAPRKAHSTDEVKDALAALEALALPDPVGDPFLGCTVGLFEVEKLVGLHRGERRYLARAVDDPDARCLLRIFPLFGASEAEFRRLSRRADAALRIEHPNLERCLGSGRTRDAYFAAFAPPVGETAAEALARRGPLPAEQVLDVVESVAQALKGLHRRSQVHGAVSPEAVRLEPGGGVVLCDAGLVRPHPAFAFLGEGELVGVPGFAAPEALDQGLLGPQADIFALGCLAWTLLSGAPPVDPQSDPRDLIERAWAPLPPLRSRDQAPPGLVALLDAMTAPDPRRRHASVNDLLADLRAVRQGETIQPITPPPRPSPAGRGGLARRSPRLFGLVLGALALALAVALAGVVAWSRSIAFEDPLEGYRLELEETGGR
ncbi:MAG: DUF4388 domain-containing protein, partial [Planctomycetes bacterium]|nr:DUF4388 domain-containing protein [Planctomycetota bacterium]